MEWVVETVLLREVRKRCIEEKDAALTLLTDDLQDRDNQRQGIQYKKVALQAQREILMREILVKTTNNHCAETYNICQR